MIIIPREICVDLDRSLDREWLVSNGIGGYSSGTVAGINTRRYHGLLVAALRPPVERTVLLSNINEEVEVGDRTFYLGANEYPDGKIHPGGFVHIEEFRLEQGIPTTVYRLGDSVLNKTVWMEHGQNTTYIRYTYVEGEGECCLVMHPLCNYRDFHGILDGSFDWDFEVEQAGLGCKITAREGAAPLYLTTVPGSEFTHTGVWYWNFVYRQEVARGYDDLEDLYMPGVIRCVLQPGNSFTVIASTEAPDVTGPLVADALEREQARRAGLVKKAGIKASTAEGDPTDPGAPIEPFAAELVRAADTFLATRQVERGGERSSVPTVLAGYHWFADWGRDTMISLPGLALPTGRSREANQTLKAFVQFARDGMLPNNFPDIGDAPHYNTADATLWLFAAIEAVADATGSTATARSLYPALSDIIAWHVRGTRFGIGMDPEDGLLRAGEEGVQLTWMDAKVDDWVVTPRHGKPVEINALWYNALRIMSKLRMLLGRTTPAGKEEAPDFAALAEQVRYSFRERFWHHGGSYLYDVVDGPGGNDASLRPNQILAVSLCKDLLTGEQARAVLTAVRAHLLTPYGLRTLSPQDPGYIGRYEGNRRERDGAYHNGTVWTWLLGPYFDAVAVVDGEDAAREEFGRLLPALRAHLAEAGIGTISEIFDGDPPHTPRGCISQAWSVSEVLRLVWGPRRIV